MLNKIQQSKPTQQEKYRFSNNDLLDMAIDLSYIAKLLIIQIKYDRKIDDSIKNEALSLDNLCDTFRNAMLQGWSK